MQNQTVQPGSVKINSMADITEQTIWFNPTPHTVRFRVLVEAGRFEKVEIAPGAKIALPSSWDRAVHDVRGGIVMGGKAPQLVRDGVTPPMPVHSSIADVSGLPAAPGMPGTLTPLPGHLSMEQKLEMERGARARAEVDLADLRSKFDMLVNKLGLGAESADKPAEKPARVK